MEEIITKEKQSVEIIKPFKVDEIVEGTVVGIGRSAIFFDLGPQGTGIIYGREFLQEKAQLKSLKLGDKIAAKIVDLENEEGYVELSLSQAGRDLKWKKLRDLKEQNQFLRVKILGVNKGGLLAELQGHQAFLPVSQLSQEHYPKVEGGDPSQILRELQKFMGKELEVEILDLDPKEEKIIISEKSKERSRLKELLKGYAVGDVVEGEITGIVEFGAFMKFPVSAPPLAEAPDLAEESVERQEEYIEGLIHISEIDWQIIDDPAKFLKVGDRVKAKIIDLSNGRVSLSLKALKEDPWKTLAEKYKKSDKVKGKVTKFNPFGAFVEVEPKIQGLCHISEFGTLANMEQTVHLGETYPFQILDLNPEEHRMSLRLLKEENAAAAQPSPEQTLLQEEKPGTAGI